MKSPSMLALGGRYTYDGEIGAGGGGRVVRARDAQSGQRVALKLVPPHALGLLRAEEKALRALEGRGLVRVLEVIRLSAPLPAPWSLRVGTGVLVETLVEGEASDAHFAARGHSVDEFWAPAIDIAIALSAVHAAGVVHGDIKPANIVVSGEGPVLVDFGLAGPPRAAAPSVSGTPAFLAPECFFGERSVATDLFALGKTFEAWVLPDGESLGSLAERHPELTALIGELVSTDAAARPASAYDVAAALARMSGSAHEMAAAQPMPAELALQLPYCGHEGVVGSLVECLEAGGVIWVTGPPGAGKTRLIREAVRRHQLEQGRRGVSVPTFVSEPGEGGVPHDSFVATSREGTLADAERAIRVATVDGHDAAYVIESDAEAPVGVTVIRVPPLPEGEFDALFAMAQARSGGALRAAKRAEAARASAYLAGRLCRLLADGLGRRRKSGEGSIRPGARSVVPAACADVALRLALAGGSLSAENLGDAALGASRLATEGLASVGASGEWRLRDDLVLRVLETEPPKRRAAVARMLRGDTLRQRAHLLAAQGAGEAAALFEQAMIEAYDGGRHSDVARLFGEARFFDIQNAGHRAVFFSSRLAAGAYDDALELASQEERPEVLRRAGRRDEALAALEALAEDDAESAYTRGWLAISVGRPEDAKSYASSTSGAGRAELLAWLSFQDGDVARAESLIEEALPSCTIRQRARLLLILGLARGGQGGIDVFVEGAGLARACGERHLEASLRGNLGAARLSAGHLGPALDSLRGAARALVELGRERDTGRALYNLARAEMMMGSVGAAARHLEQAHLASTAAADASGVEMAEEGMAELAARRGDLRLARKLGAALKSEGARLRLASAIAGSAPDLAEGLLRKCAEGSVDHDLASIRLGAAKGHDVREPLTRIAAREVTTWDDSLRVALLLSDHGPEELRSSAASKARTLLDLAASTLGPQERERMRRVPAYARVLTSVPDGAVARDGSRWRRLARAARRFGGAEGVGAVRNELVQAALELVDGERACIVERRADGTMRVSADAGVVQGAPDVSRSVVTRALDSGSPIATMDALSDEHFGAASIHALALRSLLCVPIPRSSSVVYVEDRLRPAAFGEDDRALLAELADLGAINLERCQRLEQLRGQTAQLLQLRRSLEEQTARQEAQLEVQRRAEPTLVAESAAMRHVIELATRVASANVATLIRGESGAGKEQVARHIHRVSARSHAPFVAQSCAAIPDALMESLLFGHERGAFTGAESTRAGLFEAADGGTLFLDELGEMSLAMQAAILRVTQDGVVRRVGATESRHVDVRLITATRDDLAKRIDDGRFRKDLYYRLAVVTIEVPALRERSADIAPLVEAWLHDGEHTISQQAMDALVRYEWPGNVRQLRNELERASVMADERIDLAHLSPELRGAAAGKGDFKTQVARLEMRLVEESLTRNNGNVTRTAADLGLSRYGLQKMMKRLGVERR